MTVSRSFSCPRPQHRRPSPSVHHPDARVSSRRLQESPRHLRLQQGPSTAAPALPQDRLAPSITASHQGGIRLRSRRSTWGQQLPSRFPVPPGELLVPRHSVTTTASPVPLFSQAEHRCSSPAPPSAALPAAQIRQRICELLRKLLLKCEMPKNITPASAPPASLAARDGKLPCGVYPNSHFILMSGVEILSPCFCWVL